MTENVGQPWDKPGTNSAKVCPTEKSAWDKKSLSPGQLKALARKGVSTDTKPDQPFCPTVPHPRAGTVGQEHISFEKSGTSLGQQVGQTLSPEAVLDVLITIGTWKTTKQIASEMGVGKEALRWVLDELVESGVVMRDGGPIFIWKASLEPRLRHHGFLIAIDRAIQDAVILFEAGDPDMVKDVADVYLPGEIELTPEQRSDLTGSLDYYERLKKKEKRK